MKKALPILLLVLDPFAGHAGQPVSCPGDEIASWSYVATGEIDIADPLDPEVTGRVRLQETALLAPFAEVPWGPVVLATAGWAGWTRLDFGDIAGLNTEDLYGAALALSVEHPVRERWGWSVVLMPGFYGEPRIMAQALARCRLAPAWRLELGAAWDDAFGDPQLFPIGGVVWQPADAFAARLLFPAAALNWAPATRLNLFAFLQPSGDRWADDSGRDDDWTFVIQGWRAGLGIEPRLWKSLRVRLAAGAEFERHYEAKNAGVIELDEPVDDTWFASAALVVY